MQDIGLLEMIEKYLNGSLTAEELAWFEDLRKHNSDVDHKVVEQALLLKKLDQLAERNQFKNLLANTHKQLIEEEAITEIEAPKPNKFIRFWQKNWKTATVAATIAGFITLGGLGIGSQLNTDNDTVEILKLKQEISKVSSEQKKVERIVYNSSTNPGIISKSKFGGTGFLLEKSGIIATSYHIIKGKTLTGVIDYFGNEYKASLLAYNDISDIAILKITDNAFKANELPYGLNSSSISLSDDVFTLGFPYGSLSYGKGYLSSKYGYRGDTNFVQISLPANPGQSGSPVLDGNGNVIGIISGKVETSEGVVFASKLKELSKVVKDYNKDKEQTEQINISFKKSYNSNNRNEMVNKIQTSIFQVKAD
jgi:serine protease Do